MKQTITTTKGRQGWHYTEIRDYSLEGTKRTNLYRVTIERDAYTEQCYARVERWSDEGGWKFIHALDHKADYFQFHAYTPDNDDADFTPFTKSADVLWGIVADYFLPEGFPRRAKAGAA